MKDNYRASCFTEWNTFSTKQTNFLPISFRKYTNGRWNVSIILNRKKNNELKPIFCLAVAIVALDTRLGCLEETCSRDAEKLIESINTFFWNVAEVELKMPVWRIYQNKAFKKYIGALDNFRT